MQTTHCPNCTDNFDFDPKTVWTSPGTFHGPQPGIPPAVLIPCPKCQQWLRVELEEPVADALQL